MNNEQYSEDFLWYDKSIYNAISKLSAKYPNAIPVFGGALSAYNCVNSDTPDFEKFISFFPTVIKNADFYNWHEGAVGALRRFCHICYVDPSLVELYMGMNLAELVEVQ